MTTESSSEHINWVDPDVIAYNDGTKVEYDYDKEREFKDFFDIGWLDSSYDNIRENWDSLLNDESPHARVLVKTALWGVHQLRKLRTQ